MRGMQVIQITAVALFAVALIVLAAASPIMLAA